MTLKESVIHQLRNAIVTGEYKPGERLGENQLCVRFKVSRTPVREALNALQREMLVSIAPNCGARVAELSAESVSQIYDVLAGLDGTACRLACETITERQIMELDKYQFLIEGAVEKNNLDLFFDSNIKFHLLLAECTGNPYLMEIRGNFNTLVARFARYSARTPKQLAATVEEHSNIITGIKKKNPAMAEFAAREHIERAKGFLIEHLKAITASNNQSHTVLPTG